MFGPAGHHALIQVTIRDAALQKKLHVGDLDRDKTVALPEYRKRTGMNPDLRVCELSEECSETVPNRPAAWA